MYMYGYEANTRNSEAILAHPLGNMPSVKRLPVLQCSCGKPALRLRKHRASCHREREVIKRALKARGIIEPGHGRSRPGLRS